MPYPGGYAGAAHYQSGGTSNMSDRRAGHRLLAGLSALFPKIRTVFADAGHESRKLARELMREAGWKLQITRHGQRSFKITGLAGLWSVVSPGWVATGGSVKTLSTWCRLRKHLWTSRQLASCSTESHHETFQTPSQSVPVRPVNEGAGRRRRSHSRRTARPRRRFATASCGLSAPQSGKNVSVRDTSSITNEV
jgi:hypothetical protein